MSVEWDRRFFELAKEVAKWSKDPKAHVGAVLLDALSWPIALGYNGFPAGIADDIEKLNDKDLKNQMVVHAEQNALLCSGTRARGGTLYVSGKPVCPRCAVLIIQAGIERVVGIQPDPASKSKWHKEGGLSLKMFLEKGIAFTSMEEKPKRHLMRSFCVGGVILTAISLLLLPAQNAAARRGSAEASR